VKIGVFATEIIRKIYGKSLDEAGPLMRDFIKKTFKVLNELKLDCTEFSVKLDTLEKLCKITREVSNITLLLHEPGGECSAANLSYLDSEERKHVLEKLKATVDYAAAGGFTVVTVHPASYNPRAPGYAYSDVHYKYLEPREAWETSIKYLKYLANYASRKGVLLGLENMPTAVCIKGKVLKTPHFGKDCEELLKILSVVNSESLKITLDTGHANTVCQPADYIEELVDRVIHIHIHDNDGRYDQHAPLGTGIIDFNRFFKILRENNYSNTIVVERKIDEFTLSDIEKIKQWWRAPKSIYLNKFKEA